MVLAVVGFVPCADKHRVKEASWQRFVQNLTLNARFVETLFCILTLVGRPRWIGARRIAFATDGGHGVPRPTCATSPASDFFKCFSRSGEGDSTTSAMSVAEHRQFRVLVAPHQVPREGRRRKKNAAWGRVRSFAAKRVQSAQIHLAR